MYKPEPKSRVELCGMRGGIERPAGVAGGVVRGAMERSLVVEFPQAPLPFVSCSRCTTMIVCDWLEQCAWAERIATEGSVR